VRFCSVPILISILATASSPFAALSADLAFEIQPVATSVNIAGQPVAIVVSGSISGAAAGRSQNDQPLNLSLRADLADFQNHLTPLLQVELNQSNRCGERISVEKATLVPAAPAGRLTVQLHFEKWACFKAFGKENAKRLVGGNGAVEVVLTPRVDQGHTMRLDAEIGNIDADGSLGQMLRSGSFGPALRDKIREALLNAIRKSADLQVIIPPQAQPFVAIQSIAFGDAGSGRLTLSLTARLTVPGPEISSILEQFRSKK
jgi:hypothetical protein